MPHDAAQRRAPSASTRRASTGRETGRRRASAAPLSCASGSARSSAAAATASKLPPGKTRPPLCPGGSRGLAAAALHEACEGARCVTRGLRVARCAAGVASPAGTRPGRLAYLGEGVLDGELVGGNGDGRETRDERLRQSRIGRRLEEREEVSGPVVPQRFNTTAGTTTVP